MLTPSEGISEMAVVHPDAKVGEGVTISPFTTIAADVEIGPGTWIGPNVTILDGARIGSHCRIFPGAVIAGVPQDLKYAGENTSAVIGDHTTIRECCTINRGTTDRMTTRVGSHCLLMAYTHIAHDAVVGDHCVLANCASIAGHVTIEDWVIIEGWPSSSSCESDSTPLWQGALLSARTSRRSSRWRANPSATSASTPSDCAAVALQMNSYVQWKTSTAPYMSLVATCPKPSRWPRSSCR